MENTARVLVVDDEPVVMESFSRILRREGMKVECAASGDYGLELARKNRFDVVLLDLKLPDVDGMEVLRRLKQTRPGAVVIIVTGYPSVDSAIEAMKLGACDYVAKPFSPEDIREVVARALSPGGQLNQRKGGEVGVHAHLARKALEQQARQRSGAVPRAPLGIKPRPARGLGQGRSLRTINRQGKKTAILGTGGIFGPGSELFSLLVEALKKDRAPVTAEYGSREVEGKEILGYLEDNDKVVVLAQAGPEVGAGKVVKFRANGAGKRNMEPPFDVAASASVHLADWAKATGLECDLVVIGVGPHAADGGAGLAGGRQQEIAREILAELA